METKAEKKKEKKKEKKVKVRSKPGVGKLVQMVLPSNQKKVHKKATAPSSHARWLHKNQPKGLHNCRN